MPLIVLVGNIGTGKSTYCLQNFNNDEIILRTDDWTSLNKEEKQKELLRSLESNLKLGKTVVVDGNNIRRAQRDRLLFFAKKHKTNSKIISFGSGNEVSLQRRIKNSPDTSPDFWKKIHLENKASFESPELSEGYDEIIIIN